MFGDLLRNTVRIIPASCLAAAMALCLGAPPLTAAAQDNLPSLGRGTSGLSQLEEDKLGRQFMREARGSMDFIEDPELTQYISDLGHRIAASSDEPGDDFHFYLIRDSALNAFAVPGGHVVVNTGLIMAAESEPELVAVLAHEVAHVTQHHLSRMVDKTKGQGLKMVGALVAAILLGGEAGQAAVMAANASAIENQLEYTRGFEEEADARGIQTMARAGYDPRAMAQFFEVLQRWARAYDTDAPEFLRTHPLTTHRIADARVRADDYPKPRPPDESAFYHVRAKIRAAFSGDPASTVERFAANLKSGDFENEAAERYGYALALSKAGKYDQALEAIDTLVKMDPDSVRHKTARANILMEAGRYDSARDEFERLREQAPDDYSVGIYYASALLQTKHYSEAKKLLKQLLLKNKKDPQIYSLLARAEGEMGNSLVAHQDLAEYYYLRSDLQQAYKQLKLAQKFVGDSDYARASIEARIRDIQREMEIYDEKTDRLNQ